MYYAIKYVTSNFDEYVDAQTKILNQLSTLESSSFETKKEYIIRLKEVTRPLIENGFYEGYKLRDLCSFISNELLNKHGITYNKSGDYYALFSEDEKHLEKSNMTSRTRQKISSLPIEKQTGNQTIDKLKQFARADIPQPDESDYSTYFNKIIEISNQSIKQSESLLSKLGKAYFFTEKFDDVFPSRKSFDEFKEQNKKSRDLDELLKFYESCKNTIKIIESEIKDPGKKVTELNELLAEQRFISKQIDERNKITFLEKWNSIVANIELGISAIAKRLGVNKKHLTNNVRPTENPVTHSKNMHHEYIDWFTHIQIVTPNGETFTFDAKDYFDKQIERGKLNLPIKSLVLKNAIIE